MKSRPCLSALRLSFSSLFSRLFSRLFSLLFSRGFSFAFSFSGDTNRRDSSAAALARKLNPALSSSLGLSEITGYIEGLVILVLRSPEASDICRECEMRRLDGEADGAIPVDGVVELGPGAWGGCVGEPGRPGLSIKERRRLDPDSSVTSVSESFLGELAPF